MSEPQNVIVSDDLSLYSLKKFYKSCMSFVSKQSQSQDIKNKSDYFLNCYVKMNKIYVLTKYHMTENLETSGASESNNPDSVM